MSVSLGNSYKVSIVKKYTFTAHRYLKLTSGESLLEKIFELLNTLCGCLEGVDVLAEGETRISFSDFGMIFTIEL